MHTRAIDIRTSSDIGASTSVSDDAAAKAKTPSPRQWVEAALAFLRLYVDELGRELGLYLPEKDGADYIAKVMSAIVDAAGKLETGRDLVLDCVRSAELTMSAEVLVSEHPAVKIIVIEREATLSDNQDGCELAANVQNALPCVSLHALLHFDESLRTASPLVPTKWS
jgi:hypothetical protein